MNDKEAKETLKTMKENIDKKYLKTRNSVAIETVLNLIENQKAEIEEKDREIIRLGRKANEYKKAINCKDCDCSVCEAHINTLELRAEIEKKDAEYSDLKLKYEQNLRMCKHFRTELNKQDNIIELLTEFIKNNMSEKKIINEVCIKGKCNNEECHEDDLKQCIKQYFEKKSEEDK